MALAQMLRTFGPHAAENKVTTSDHATAPAEAKLSRRLRQTLNRLLIGDSEKQIASNLRVSQHTVHVYVKALYKLFDVNSRGELLAQFIQRPSAEAD